MKTAAIILAAWLFLDGILAVGWARLHDAAAQDHLGHDLGEGSGFTHGGSTNG